MHCTEKVEVAGTVVLARGNHLDLVVAAAAVGPESGVDCHLEAVRPSID